MKLISAGEKIRKLRLEAGLNQEDLTNEEITRGLISMIENNRRNLTYRTATIIANILNQHYQKLGKRITPEYLIETDIQQAERLIEEELGKIQYIFNNPMPGNTDTVEVEIDRLINFSKEWNLDHVTAKLLEKRGRFYTGIYQYEHALKNYFLALEYYLKENMHQSVVSLYTVIASSHYHLSLYPQALLYYQQAENVLIQHFDAVDNALLKKGYTIYNKTLCYRRLKDYKAVCKEIERYKELDIKNDYLSNLMLLLEGDTYRDLSIYDKAETIYNKILERTEDTSELLLFAYDGYAKLHYEKGNYQKSFECINKALSYASGVKPKYAIDLLSNSKDILYALGSKWNLKVSLDSNQ